MPSDFATILNHRHHAEEPKISPVSHQQKSSVFHQAPDTYVPNSLDGSRSQLSSLTLPPLDLKPLRPMLTQELTAVPQIIEKYVEQPGSSSKTQATSKRPIYSLLDVGSDQGHKHFPTTTGQYSSERNLKGQARYSTTPQHLESRFACQIVDSNSQTLARAALNCLGNSTYVGTMQANLLTPPASGRSHSTTSGSSMVLSGIKSPNPSPMGQLHRSAQALEKNMGPDYFGRKGGSSVGLPLTPPQKENITRYLYTQDYDPSSTDLTDEKSLEAAKTLRTLHDEPSPSRCAQRVPNTRNSTPSTTPSKSSSAKSKASKAHSSDRYWSKNEEAIMAKSLDNGKTWDEISASLSLTIPRTRDACRMRWSRFTRLKYSEIEERRVEKRGRAIMKTKHKVAKKSIFKRTSSGRRSNSMPLTMHGRGRSSSSYGSS